MTDTIAGQHAAYQCQVETGSHDFRQLLRSEWTKLRTVRGWVISLVAAALVTVLFGLLSVPGVRTPCGGGPNCGPPVGPDGEAVIDASYFVRQPLPGDASITVRVTSLTGSISSAGAASLPGAPSGPVPWAKAGIMIRASAAKGSSYAAIMVTADHGVRMQYDYVHDIAGRSGKVAIDSPRWLRLTRTGDTVTGFESPNGSIWTQVGTAHLVGSATGAVGGMFVASPQYEETNQQIGRLSTIGDTSQASGDFDHVSLAGADSGGGWTGNEAEGGSGGGAAPPAVGFDESGGRFTVTGSGDIGPAVAGPEGNTIEHSLVGAFVGLIIVVIVGAIFIAAEYRRGLIRTTLAASPRRGPVLWAKAIVLGSATFVVGLAAAASADWFVGGLRRERGEFILPVPTTTEIRVVVGTALLLALAAMFAMAVGAMLRRGAATVAAVIASIVLPYLLAIASVLPVSAAQWVLRVTPAAGFAIQQSTPQYDQVSTTYSPATGFYPLAPWAGFAVLCGWTALALGLATLALRRRDA